MSVIITEYKIIEIKTVPVLKLGSHTYKNNKIIILGGHLQQTVVSCGMSEKLHFELAFEYKHCKTYIRWGIFSIT